MTPQEHALLRRRQAEARRLGRDLFEYLDSKGEILTMVQINRIRTMAFLELADRLEQASVQEIIKRYGSNTHTALDAQRGLVAMIRDIAVKEGN